MQEGLHETLEYILQLALRYDQIMRRDLVRGKLSPVRTWHADAAHLGDGKYIRCLMVEEEYTRSDPEQAQRLKQSEERVAEREPREKGMTARFGQMTLMGRTDSRRVWYGRRNQTRADFASVGGWTPGREWF